jgi:hypothetical protein
MWIINILLVIIAAWNQPLYWELRNHGVPCWEWYSPTGVEQPAEMPSGCPLDGLGE